MQTIKDEKELATALVSRADTLIIVGDLAKNVNRIHTISKHKWYIFFGALAACAPLFASGPIAIPVILVALGFTAGLLGRDVVITAIKIALATGKVDILNHLRREYKVVEYAVNRLVLERK